MEKLNLLKETESRYSDSSLKVDSFPIGINLSDPIRYFSILRNGIEIRINNKERVMKDFYFIIWNGSILIEKYVEHNLEVSLYCTTPLSTQDLVTISASLNDKDYLLSEEDSLYLLSAIESLRVLYNFTKSKD